MPINPDYQFEKLLMKPIEKQEEKAEKESSNDIEKQDKEPPRKKIKISPKDAHRIALKLIKLTSFKDKLKEYVAEKIVHGENITRLDVIIEKGNNQQLRKTYGITKEHFKDIANGNLINFDLASDGTELAIYFKRTTGEPAIRLIDNTKLANLLNVILNIRPELASTDIQSDIQSK